MVSLKIPYLDPTRLKPRQDNPRTHSPKQIRQIATSIQQFGFVSPVLVDGQGSIIAGHGRVEAAKSLGMSDIPTVRVDHLSPAQIQAYVIADNKRQTEKTGDGRLQIGIFFCSDCLTLPLSGGTDVTNFSIWKLPGVAGLGGWGTRIRT